MPSVSESGMLLFFPVMGSIWVSSENRLKLTTINKLLNVESTKYVALSTLLSKKDPSSLSTSNLRAVIGDW